MGVLVFRIDRVASVGTGVGRIHLIFKFGPDRNSSLICSRNAP
jgi:hypothetical protein